MSNKSIIEYQIRQKVNSQGPYFPNPNIIFKTKTDVNVFPYQRFFRGVAADMHPNIWDREAGYSPLISTIDTTNDVNQALFEKSTTCFQYPCTTILPCYSDIKNFQETSNSKVYTSP